MLALLLIPIITAIICYNMRNPRIVGYVSLIGVATIVVCAFPVIAASLAGSVSDLSGTFSMDAL